MDPSTHVIIKEENQIESPSNDAFSGIYKIEGTDLELTQIDAVETLQ